MCSGRVDLEFVFRAFARGHDGVLIGGCRLNECNYATHGNYDALANVYIARKIMARIGLDPGRLGIEFMSGGEGNRLAEVVDAFTESVRGIGPLGRAEGLEAADLRMALEAARWLIPYLRLVERGKLRAPEKSEAAYREFYESDAVERLCDELIGEKLTVGKIVHLLRESPLRTDGISA